MTYSRVLIQINLFIRKSMILNKNCQGQEWQRTWPRVEGTKRVIVDGILGVGSDMRAVSVLGAGTENEGHLFSLYPGQALPTE